MNDSQRHSVWTVAGWLGIIFGAIGILYSCGIALFIIGSFFDSLGRRGAPWPTGASELLPALGFVLLPAFFLGASLLAFYAGRGLLRRRSYGRICTLLFGALSIIGNILATFFLWKDFLVHVWQTLQKTELPNGPSLASRFVEVLELTPLYLGYSIGLALLCRSVYLHREAFNSRPRAESGSTQIAQTSLR
jgi:hypothetical protein